MKDEVEVSLVTSLLTRSERSLFWAAELYYSGFGEELFALFWKIYYDFYAVLNPTLWEYLSKKQKEFPENPEIVIACIIKTFLLRPVTLDMYFLRIVQDDCIHELLTSLKEANYISIRNQIFSENSKIKEILEKSLDFFECHGEKREKLTKKWARSRKCPQIDSRVHLLSLIMSFFSQQSGKPPGKNFYGMAEPEEITKYNTLLVDEKRKHYKILEEACRDTIDSDNHLSLFYLERNKFSPEEVKKAYYHDWLYYASFSPVWSERIYRYGGEIVHDTRKIVFTNEDNEQEFYENFGYEPDEQKQTTIQKSIQPIVKERTWESFYDEHKQFAQYKPSNLSLWGEIKY